jgi:hypothetical protein
MRDYKIVQLPQKNTKKNGPNAGLGSEPYRTRSLFTEFFGCLSIKAVYFFG